MLNKKTGTRKNSQVSRDVHLVHGLYDELDLLPLKLENLPAFEVAAAECGARDDIPCQVLHLWPNIKLAWLLVSY
jgi:hypothetical protein